MWAKVKAIVNTVWADICDTWKRVKIYIIGILAIVAIMEWRQIKEKLMVKMGEKELASTDKKDETLAKIESTDKAQANALEQQAQQLPSTETSVKPDWYTKKDPQ